MQLTQIRNATLLVDYAGKTLLVDPLLAARGAYPGFAGTANSHLANPLVDLPVPLAALLGVDAVLVTHLHLDHWDETARRVLPKGLPVFAQDEADARAIRADGFTDVRPLAAAGGTPFGGIRIARTDGQHGSDALMAAAPPAFRTRMGEVSGIVLRHPGEPTLYIAGDTVWNAHVAAALETYDPDVVVLNCGDAQVPGLGAIIMDLDGLAQVARAAPHAAIVASHLEAVNHCVLSRADVRAWRDAQGMQGRVYVPGDGEPCVFIHAGAGSR